MAGSSATNVKVIYVLYLASLIFGVTAFIGLVMAYVYRREATDWAISHHTYQVRTFWIGFLYSLIGAILSLVVVGFLILILVAVWFVVRCVRGLQYAAREEPMPEPETWLW